MTRFLRAFAAAVAVTLIVGGSIGSAVEPSGAQEDLDREEAGGLVLTQQSTLVGPDGVFAGSVRPAGQREAAGLRVSVHDRVRSRSELADANRGAGLRTVVRSATFPLADLPADPDGSRRFSLALSGGEQRAVTTPGVYPTEVATLDSAGRVLEDIVTALVVRPPASDATPPLAVAVLAEMGTTSGRPSATAPSQAFVDALGAVPEATATLAVGPAWIEQLARSADPADAALLSALRGAAADRPLLALPYVTASPDALTAAGIAEEFPHHLDRGAAVVTEHLGVPPRQSTWLSGPDLGGDGLRLLSALGIGRALVVPEQVERVSDGVLSPARPFLLAPPKEAGKRPEGPDTPVKALLTDARIVGALGSDAAPALVAARSTADLAMLWFEQPGTARTAVVPIGPSVDPLAVVELLRSLRGGVLFRTVAIDEAFDAAAELKDASRSPLRRSLSPTEGDDLPSDISRTVRTVRARRASVQAMVGAGTPALADVDRHLLRATGADLDAAVRRRELRAAQVVVDNLAAQISAPASVTITLTAREGTVPLTIRNDSGIPVSVRLNFASSKLELPDGDERMITLIEPITRLDIAVRTRSSGAFPFTVDITSPDGAVDLASTTYSVRSTAVSGVGLFLSLGAGLFLVVWWARHWRQSNRSRKLVAEPDATPS